jgi:septin family protein
VEKKTIELDEDGVTIRLTVCDTPGFGDNIDNESAFSTIIGYLEKQYDDILAEESRIKRNPRFEDQRIHALLYFIPPTGHRYILSIFQIILLLADFLSYIQFEGNGYRVDETLISSS